MTLQQLKYIIKVVECGSITEAAKQLLYTQPSLSTAVKELENELGIEIFYRTPKEYPCLLMVLNSSLTHVRL
jgi:DNA-binding transcriptional LysR family regulator